MKHYALTATLSIFLLLCRTAIAEPAEILQVMLQGSSAPQLSKLVKDAGGTVTHDLHIIDAVGAKLTRAQLDEVLKSPLVTRHIDDLAGTDRPAPKPDDEDEECKVRGHIELDFTPQGIRWPLFNKKAAPIRLESLEVTWPERLGAIKSISMGDTKLAPELYNQTSEGPLKLLFAESSGPVLETRENLDINFQSPDAADANPPPAQSDFTIEAAFLGGCSTELVPGYADNHENYYYNEVAGVDALHRQGITGKGVTVAVLDSGLWEKAALTENTAGENRVVARFNALKNTVDEEVTDESGHGTHMTSIIAHNGPTLRLGQPTGSYKGVAPDVNLVAVKLLDREGLAHLFEIVRAIQWVVDNRKKYDIRILNLSFAQTPRWNYWDDPVNQAAMKAWAAGIVVVAAAGNEGPDAMTIGSPGNLPYIITVGAVTDSWTPSTRDDDYIPDFSSRGPTPSGHIKPDIVALGGHMTGLIRPESALAVEQPEDILRTGEFVSTGSSQATALVSGILALLLQLEPELTPDDLKCKLISSAEPAINRDGLLSYSPFEQGFGYVSATRAVTLGKTGCGNTDWDLQADIKNKEHYFGPALVDDDGGPTLPGLQDMVSGTTSETGPSENRKWGVKAHIERADLPPPYKKLPFDWHDLYLEEKAAIERLSHQPD